MAKTKTTTINTVFGERVVPPHEDAEAYAKFHRRASQATKPGDFIDEIRAQIFADQNWHYAQYEALRSQLFEKLQGWQSDRNPFLEFGQAIGKLETVDRLSSDAVKFSNDIYAAIEQRRELFADRKPQNGEQVERAARATKPSNDNIESAFVSDRAAPEKLQKIAKPNLQHTAEADGRDERDAESTSDMAQTSAAPPDADSADAESGIENRSNEDVESAARDLQEDIDDAGESEDAEVEQTAYEPDDVNAGDRRGCRSDWDRCRAA